MDLLQFIETHTLVDIILHVVGALGALVIFGFFVYHWKDRRSCWDYWHGRERDDDDEE